MSAHPIGSGELDAYREEADRFVAALDEEFYLHFAGLKETLELAPIYERFSELSTLETCERLGAASAEDARLTELWRFACEGYLGNLTREQAERLAGLEATLTAKLKIGGRVTRVRRKSPDGRIGSGQPSL